MVTQSEQLASPRRELARLQALARIAGAAAHAGGLDGVLQAIVEGIQSAFGLEAVLNLYDEELDAYVVRAMVGDGEAELMLSRTKREAFEGLLTLDHEVVPDVFFIPHSADVDMTRFGAVHTPDHGWPGPGFWHPDDMCFVRMRTSQGKSLGILSVDSSIDQRVPDAQTLELLRLFAMVGANAAENVMLLSEVAALEAEREKKRLRQELEEELALRQSLLEIGSRVGAASAAASSDIFPLVAERLATVVPIKSLTISTVDNDSRSVRPVYHSEEGPIAEAVIAFQIPFGTGVTGTAVVRQRSVISNAEDPEETWVQIPDTPEVDEHVLAVPVQLEEQVRIVLTLRREGTEPPFLPIDAHRAELFAQHLSSAFLLMELGENRRLLAEQVEKLERLNRLKDEFVANVSHDLRTPLTAIIGNVVTVAGLGDMLGAEERRELLVGAERQAKRLAELLENLLAESRLTGDDPSLVPVMVELGPFVEEVAATLRFRAPGRSIETRSPKREPIVTDRTLLYRILFNLADNALKYSDGPIRISVEPDDEGVTVAVADRGIGIAEQDISRIFERFEQLDPADGRKVGGVGLGLHLAARAAEALGGHIDVQSAPGQGSIFRLWLPRDCRRGRE